MNTDDAVLDWPEIIIMFNSLIRNIEELRRKIDSDSLDDSELYEAEEELNDYVTLLPKLRQRFYAISDKGELPEKLAKKIREIC